jgi:hypothetical protein
VLITTQNPNWPSGQALDVPVLDSQVAAGFLVNRTGDPDERAATALADELGGLPLALEQAAAYIQVAGTTLAGYLSVFGDRRADLLPAAKLPGTRRMWRPPWGWRCPGCGMKPRRQRGCCGCWRA